MYRDEVPVIRGHAYSGPDGLADVILFAILTIQQPLTMVPTAFVDVKAKGEASTWLFGFKKAGWQYIQEHKDALWRDVTTAPDLITVMDSLLKVPSIGLVKAGFICQLLGMEAGCIDTHNQDRFKVKYPRFNKTLKAPFRVKKIKAYLKLTKHLGGAEKLWDSWCHYVASERLSASTISRMHCSAMGLEPSCPF